MRVHKLDVLLCRSCGGRLQILAFRRRGEMLHRSINLAGAALDVVTD